MPMLPCPCAPSKSDRNDAHGLAEMVRMGWCSRGSGRRVPRHMKGWRCWALAAGSSICASRSMVGIRGILEDLWPGRRKRQQRCFRPTRTDFCPLGPPELGPIRSPDASQDHGDLRATATRASFDPMRRASSRSPCLEGRPALYFREKRRWQPHKDRCGGSVPAFRYPAVPVCLLRTGYRRGVSPR